MPEFKNKLYYLVSGQLPAYVREEYPIFVDFLEAYYKFLDEPNQVNNIILNSETWSDIDLTLDIFLPNFRNQYAQDISTSALIDIRRLLKHIHEYYESKGSENATQLFFRFMFNETATVAYPGDYILRASDGRWHQNNIIKVDTSIFGNISNIYDLKHKVINLFFMEPIAGAGYSARVVENVKCSDVFGQIESGIYQLEVDLPFDYPFPDILSSTPPPGSPTDISLGNYDTYVYIQLNDVTYGSISRQIVSITSINIEGTKFSENDAYIISEIGVEQKYFAELYVEETPGYVLDTFDNNAIVAVDLVGSKPLSDLLKLNIVTTGQKFSSRGVFALNSPYFGDWYVDNTPGNMVADNDNLDYGGDTEGYGPIDSFTIIIPPKDSSGVSAEVVFKTGLVYKTPGFYKDSSGFISDINKLQDNYYYQPYSYVVRSPVPLQKWGATYLKSNHPTGFRMFSELELIDTIDDYPNLDTEGDITTV